MEKSIAMYKTKEGKEPFVEWITSLKDKTSKGRIEVRVERIKQGNYGDHGRFGGILEIKMHFGKGYRIYCGEDGDIVVVLLCGGDKSSQDKDIRKALEYWEDYHDQKKV